MRIPTRSASAQAPVADAPSSGTPDSRRRRFLFTLGVGSAGVAVSAKASVVAVTEATDTHEEAADGRYRETDHVQHYYRTAKL